MKISAPILFAYALLAGNNGTAATSLRASGGGASMEKIAAIDCLEHGDEINCRVDMDNSKLVLAQGVSVCPPNSTQPEYVCVRDQGSSTTKNSNAWYVLQWSRTRV